MLPNVKINFANGALGSVAPTPDGVCGLAVTAVAVSSTFDLAKAYMLKSLAGLAPLGITSASNDANAFLYKTVKDFYDQSGDGAELWIMGFANTISIKDICDVTNNHAKGLLLAASGRIRHLAVAFSPASGYTPTIEGEIDKDVIDAIPLADALAGYMATDKFAPVRFLIEAREFSGTVATLKDLTTLKNNRVAVVMGDTATTTKGACVGAVLGRIAKVPVQRHIGRVLDGPMRVEDIYIKDVTADLADVATITDKGYVTFRTFVGKSGYYIADDHQATEVSDDYRSIARGRVIDKAFRIAYQAFLNTVNDEVPIKNDGTITIPWAKAVEAEVERAIINNMTVNGNLGADPEDPNDTGVKCFIDPAQNVVSTSKITATLRVKPHGYNKYVEVSLGFLIEN